MSVIYAVCMILGCFLGAGFVSGREVASYFSKFGGGSWFSIIIVTILMFVLILFFLLLSKKTNSFENFVQVYFGRCKNLIYTLFAICVLIVTGSMFAGTRALAKDLNISSVIFVGATFVLCYLVLLGNIGGLKRANLLLVPFLLVILVISCMPHFKLINFEASKVFLASVSGVNYVFINIATLGMFLIEIGNQYTTKQKFLIAIFSSIIIGIMLIILNFAIIGGGLQMEVLPSINLVKNKPVLQICMQISIYFGLFTTLLSNVYLISKFLSFMPYKLSIFVSLVMGLIISSVGFEMIVGYFYSVIGFVGILMLFGVIIKSRKQKLL